MRYTYFPTKDDRKEFIINVKTGKRIGAKNVVIWFLVCFIALFAIYYIGVCVLQKSTAFLILFFLFLFCLIRAISFIFSYFFAIQTIHNTMLPDNIDIEISEDFIRKNDIYCNRTEIADIEIYKHFLFVGVKDSMDYSVTCIPINPSDQMKIEEILNDYGYIYQYSGSMPQIVINATKNNGKKKRIINNIFVIAYFVVAAGIISALNFHSYMTEKKYEERMKEINQETNVDNNESTYQNEEDITTDEEISENEKDIENGLYEIYSAYYLGKEGYSFTTTYDAKGVEQAIIYDEESTVRYITYDRFSKNGKCLLYVVYENEKDSDGSYSPADAKILDMYAYDFKSGLVILSGRKGWADVGNKEYREATGE